MVLSCEIVPHSFTIRQLRSFIAFSGRTCRHPSSYCELPTIWIKYYQGGCPVRESTVTMKETVARCILRTREGDVEKGIPINPKMDRIRLEDAAKDLLNDYNANGGRSVSEAKRRLEKHLAPFFRGRQLARITMPDVRA